MRTPPPVAHPSPECLAPLAFSYSMPSDDGWEKQRHLEIVYQTSNRNLTVATRETVQTLGTLGTKFSIEEVYYGRDVPLSVESAVKTWTKPCSHNEWKGELVSAVKCIARDIKRRCERNACDFCL